jgi:hypothetical protein
MCVCLHACMHRQNHVCYVIEQQVKTHSVGSTHTCMSTADKLSALGGLAALCCCCCCSLLIRAHSFALAAAASASSSALMASNRWPRLSSPTSTSSSSGSSSELSPPSASSALLLSSVCFAFLAGCAVPWRVRANANSFVQNRGVTCPLECSASPHRVHSSAGNSKTALHRSAGTVHTVRQSVRHACSLR